MNNDERLNIFHWKKFLTMYKKKKFLSHEHPKVGKGDYCVREKVKSSQSPSEKQISSFNHGPHFQVS